MEKLEDVIDDYAREQMEYDHEKADKLVGKTIELNFQGKYLVKDHVHYHFFLVREDDGFFKMEKAKHILETLAENEEIEELEQENAIGNIFLQKGAYKSKWGSCDGPTFIVDGVLGGVKRSGCMLDIRTVACEISYGGLQLGSGGMAYSFCHTFKKDASKPCGYKVVDGSNELELDKQDWFPIEQLHEKMMETLAESLDKHIPMKGKEFCYTEGKTLDRDEQYNFAFWEPGSEKAYRFHGPWGIDESWHKCYYSIDIGDVKKKQTKLDSGMAQTHSRNKWTLSKNHEKKSGDEIRAKILEIVSPVVKEISYRREHE